MRNFKKLSLFLAIVMVISSLSMGVFAESYVVKGGDVLWKIAKTYGTDSKTLAEYNNLETQI